MRRPPAALVGCLLAALLPACSTVLPEATVGHVVVEWDEATDAIEGFDKQADPLLLSTEAQWQDWVDALPGEMREARNDAIEAVDLDDSVLLVAVWGRCTEEGNVADVGGGAVRFELHDPEPHTLCAWSPIQVQVWDLPLSELDVERGEVHLVP